MKIISLLLCSLLLLSACGGSSAGDSGVVIQGTLKQGSVSSHAKSSESSLAHVAGSKIGGVNICALGECSLTDDSGQWGFAASSAFSGGGVLFTAEGHGISSSFIAEIPPGAKDVVLDLVNYPTGVKLEHITVDGETEHLEETHSDSHGEYTVLKN